jgi:excinuclease ABC subunit C
MVASAASVEAIACASPHEAAWLERNLLEADKPRWNRTLGGQESQVFVRLDGDPARPRLGVVYRPQPAPGVRFFGPYLGGSRVRRAVQGLRRVVPLELSGERLRGTTADIADLRGVSSADREELIERAAAILDREPAAIAWVLAGLSELRERASSTLAFELAAIIHEEIRGMEWVTSLQRVTSADGGDFEVCAWHDGVAVEFGVRSGRLREWRQEARPRPRPGPGLGPGQDSGPEPDIGSGPGSSPAGLAELARHTAELAAAMRHAQAR